jgi:hypothetical protein
MTVMHMKAIALLLTVFTSGCGVVGVATVSPTECSPTEAKVFEWEATGTTEENYVLDRKPSKQDFLSGRGHPDEIITVNSVEEVWVYKRSIWCGFVVAYIIPVPLVLPVCDGVDRITFEGETVKQIQRTGQNATGLMVGSNGITTHGEDCYGDWQNN